MSSVLQDTDFLRSAMDKLGLIVDQFTIYGKTCLTSRKLVDVMEKCRDVTVTGMKDPDCIARTILYQRNQDPACLKFRDVFDQFSRFITKYAKVCEKICVYQVDCICRDPACPYWDPENHEDHEDPENRKNPISRHRQC